jgi:tetratricopeptide (TPR) repeat protein
MIGKSHFPKAFPLVLVFILAIGGAALPKEIDPRPALQRLIDSPDRDQQWKGLSLLVSYYRDRGEYNELTKRLQNYMASKPDSPLAPLLQSWIADNYRMSGDHQKCLAALQDLTKKYGALKEDGRSWAARALEIMAEVHLAAQDRQSAITAMTQLISDHSSEISPGWARYRLAKLYLATGQNTLATPLLDEIQQKFSKEQVPFGDETVAEMARQALDLARSDKRWVRTDRQQLVRELSRAIDKRDTKALTRLASPIAFYWAVLGRDIRLPKSFKDDIASLLEAGWREARPSLHLESPISESDGKAYARTTGWKAPHLTEDLWLLLTKTEYGWEWNGIILTSPMPLPKGWEKTAERRAPGGLEVDERIIALAGLGGVSGILGLPPGGRASSSAGSTPSPLPPADPPDGQPLRFELKAPWQEDGYMLSGSDHDTVYGGSCTDTVGWTGWYYGEGDHTGKDYYAMDFTRWTTVILDYCKDCYCRNYPVVGRRCICAYYPCPVPQPRGGYEVKSVSPGRVRSADWGNGKVEIEHRALGDKPDGYSSRYLHMKDISVSVGQYVARGTTLGKVDDKGSSTGAHLHFVLYDNQVCSQSGAVCPDSAVGQSVMLSPLEGENRGPQGVAKCIKSTNVNTWADEDGDQIPDTIDNCVSVANPEQADWNNDGIGNSCQDSDGDGVLDANDNCLAVTNRYQQDMDEDGIGDACDPDKDGDATECGYDAFHRYKCGEGSGKVDNCPDIANADQLDTDQDGIGNVCDTDIDGDGLPNGLDSCPLNGDSSDKDSDGDGVGDVCDNCPQVYQGRFEFFDADEDGIGDKCDSGDADGDGVADKDDACPSVPNSNACIEQYLASTIEVQQVRQLRDLIEIAVILRNLNDKLVIPIGPGPVCLSCPEDRGIQADLTLEGVPSELSVSLYDHQGRDVSSAQRKVLGDKITFTPTMVPRGAYYLLISPAPSAKIGETYKFKFGLKYHDSNLR